MNEQIRVPEVRLIDHEGNQIGVVTLSEAQQAAKEHDLDLVEISPNADPPVCRVLDYGKYLFEQSKKQAAAKKKQKRVQIKEIKFRPTTDISDYQVKLRRLIQFLQHGDKVKASVRFRGREMVHRGLGQELLKRVEGDLSEFGAIEQYPRMEGRQIFMVISPKKNK